MNNYSDDEILKNIQDNGTLFFDQNKENYDNSTITQYHILYINNELFDNDCCLEYLNYMLINTFDVWKSLTNIIESHELYECLLTIVNCIFENFDLDKKMTIFRNIMLDKCLDLVNFDILDKTLMNLIVESLLAPEITPDISDIIFNFFGNKNFLDTFIAWSANIYNHNIPKLNMENLDELIDFKKYDRYHYLIKILEILLNIWNRIETSDVIDKNYLISKNCPIKWYSCSNDNNDNNDNTKYPLKTKLFFLMLHAMRIGYVPSYQKKKYFQKLLKDYKNEEEYILKNKKGGDLTILTNIYNDISKINILLQDFEKATSLISSIYLHDNYFYYVIDLIHEDIEFQLDDILWIFIDFSCCIINPISMDNYYTDNITTTLLDICKDKNMTSNYDIKYKSIKIIKNMWDNLCPENEEQINLYINCMILLHNDIDAYNTFIATKMSTKSLLRINIKETYLEYSENEGQYFKLSTDMLKFCNIIMSDIFDIDDNIKTCINECNELNNLLTSSSMLQKMIYLSEFNNYLKEIFIFMVEQSNIISLMSLMCDNDNLKSCMLNESVVNNLPRLLNVVINRIVEGNQYISKTTLAGFSYNIVEYVEDILEILIVLYRENINFLRQMKLDKQNFKYENIELFFSNVIDNLSDKKDSEILDENIDSEDSKDSENNQIMANDMITNIICFFSDLETEEKFTSEIPDEYLDPLTYSPIEDPVLLPFDNNDEMQNIFMEKSTLIKHLLNKEENPFTRSRLTIDELEAHNKTEENINKINIFKQSFDKWKLENKI